MSLLGAIQKLQAHALTLGVKDAPTYPIEGSAVFPFSVAYPATGSYTLMAGGEKGLHTVFVEFHCSRTMLPQAVAQAIDFLVGYPPLLLADPTLGGEVSTLLLDNQLTYDFGRLGWDTVQTIGVRFTVRFKLQRTLP